MMPLEIPMSCEGTTCGTPYPTVDLYAFDQQAHAAALQFKRPRCPPRHKLGDLVYDDLCGCNAPIVRVDWSVTNNGWTYWTPGHGSTRFSPPSPHAPTRMPAESRWVLLDEGTAQWSGTLGEFVAANELHPDEAAALAALEIGQEHSFGGGASPLLQLRRIA